MAGNRSEICTTNDASRDTEAAMLYDVNTPAEYLDSLDDDWRLATLQKLRALIKAKAPTLEEGINYKMLSYGDARGHAFHLNAQKSYVSFYVGDIKKVDPDGEFLAGLSLGKGCVRFKKTSSVEDSRIDEFIERAASLWNQGADIDC